MTVQVPEYMVSSVTLTCRTCGTTTVPNLQRRGPNIGAYCSLCSSYIMFVKQTQVWIALERMQRK